MMRIHVPADVESLKVVNVFVSDLAAEGELIPARAYLLRLAVEELVVNVVSHGYAPAEHGLITLEGRVTDFEVWLRLTDRARPFDPFKVDAPVGLDRPLKDREPGSLGLFLVNHAVDRAFYEYVDGANRSTILMWRVRPAEDGQARSVRGNTDRDQSQPQRRGAGLVADAAGGRGGSRSDLARRGLGGAAVVRPFV